MSGQITMKISCAIIKQNGQSIRRQTEYKETDR